jgi:hypothetical protein
MRGGKGRGRERSKRRAREMRRREGVDGKQKNRGGGIYRKI